MTDVGKTGSAISRSKPRLNRRRHGPPWSEASVWRPLGSGWRQLYGGFYEVGVSVEWQEFELYAFEWSRSFHPESLELCLNLAGHGSIHCVESAVDIEPLTAAFYSTGRGLPRAWRDSHQRHQFITVEFSPRFLRTHLGACDGALHPLVEGFMRGRRPRAGVGEIHRLTVTQEQRLGRLLNPPVPQGARRLWFQGMVLELMAEFFFERQGDDELFCDRQKRLARERVDRVMALLRGNLVEPPSLEEIGRQVGCSPFHLSRTFSAETGTTIPQCLRRLRMELAAELLQSGKYNVTEAAMTVGYSSLSHFSQSFCQTMGCCPGLYPSKTPTQKANLSCKARCFRVGEHPAAEEPECTRSGSS